MAKQSLSPLIPETFLMIFPTQKHTHNLRHQTPKPLSSHAFHFISRRLLPISMGITINQIRISSPQQQHQLKYHYYFYIYAIFINFDHHLYIYLNLRRNGNGLVQKTRRDVAWRSRQPMYSVSQSSSLKSDNPHKQTARETHSAMAVWMMMIEQQTATESHICAPNGSWNSIKMSKQRANELRASVDVSPTTPHILFKKNTCDYAMLNV